jgi:endonuclease-3
MMQAVEFGKLYRRLKKLYPRPLCALVHRNAFELLAATILSAQCTDKRVNLVTPALFARYPTPAALAAASPEDVEALVHTTGFFRNKAKSLLGMATAVTYDHGGVVPSTMEALVRLPGVARKTANVVLGVAYGIAAGVVVDTHVARLSKRLGLSAHTDPVKIERDLMALVPRKHWIDFSNMLILHGRSVCDARRPACEHCTLQGLCPSYLTGGNG